MATNFTTTQSAASKAYARLKMIASDFFEKWRDYSFMLAVYNTLWWIGNYSRWQRLHFYAMRKLTHWADKNLMGNYYADRKIFTPPYGQDFTDKSLESARIDDKDYRIWVFWWQGVESMPTLVRGCYSQLMAHNDNVQLITRDNYSHYCHIPDYILSKLQRKELSITHLSDIMRVNLLADYGGIWFDATCYITRTLPTTIRDYTFFSPRTKGLPDMPLWSNSRWCIWALGTNQRNNPLFCFIRDVMNAVLKVYRSWPFYLFTDYLFDYAYRKFPEVNAMIDSNPENNTRRNDLHFMLNKPFDENQYEELCSGNNYVFKLSYKTSWKSQTVGGATTFYGRLIEHKDTTV